ncbi:MAG: adenosylmethionine decarboxylase [Chloroflexi bacterium]|nr:adenosylmethionine decarboxylase [Chloroflexota bacterium]
MEPIGRHLLLELKDCNRELLSDLDFLRNTLLSAAREAGATIMGDSFHVFEPYGGVSGVVIIAESHLSIHTWPEYGYAAVDIFTCGDSLHPELAVDLLANALEAKNTSTLELKRGILDSEDEPWR